MYSIGHTQVASMPARKEKEEGRREGRREEEGLVPLHTFLDTHYSVLLAAHTIPYES